MLIDRYFRIRERIGGVCAARQFPSLDRRGMTSSPIEIVQLNRLLVIGSAARFGRQAPRIEQGHSDKTRGHRAPCALECGRGRNPLIGGFRRSVPTSPRSPCPWWNNIFAKQSEVLLKDAHRLLDVRFLGKPPRFAQAVPEPLPLPGTRLFSFRRRPIRGAGKGACARSALATLSRRVAFPRSLRLKRRYKQ
jgi:hypothetical protein